MEFKVGDRVRVITHDTDATYGDLGTITCIDTGISHGRPYVVEFDVSRVGYHTCSGRTRRSRGYWLNECEIELVEDGSRMEIPQQKPLIIIYEKDGKVIARDKRTNKCGAVEKNGDFIHNAILALMELDENERVQITK